MFIEVVFDIRHLPRLCDNITNHLFCFFLHIKWVAKITLHFFGEGGYQVRGFFVYILFTPLSTSTFSPSSESDSGLCDCVRDILSPFRITSSIPSIFDTLSDSLLNAKKTVMMTAAMPTQNCPPPTPLADSANAICGSKKEAAVGMLYKTPIFRLRIFIVSVYYAPQYTATPFVAYSSSSGETASCNLLWSCVRRSMSRVRRLASRSRTVWAAGVSSCS